MSQISHAALTDNSQIQCPKKMGFPRSVLSANQNAATAIQATEIQRVFAVERAKVFELERVDIDFWHVSLSLPLTGFPRRP